MNILNDFLELEEKMKMEINSCNTYSKIINIRVCQLHIQLSFKATYFSIDE